MKQLNKITGNKGEILVQNYLKKLKYKILEANYSCKLGEIDIIAKEKDSIVFIEVKTRTSNMYGRPCEAVTPYKQNKIRAVAKYYLMLKGWLEENVRFDVIEIYAPNGVETKKPEINHLEDAFQ